MKKDLNHSNSVASQRDTLASNSTTTKVKKMSSSTDSQPGTTIVPDEVEAQGKKTSSASIQSNGVASTHIVTADSVQAEEVPTIPLESLQTINALQPEVAVHSVAPTQSVRIPTPLVVQSSEYRRSPGEWLHLWWDGIRPRYLTLSLLPALLGTTLAWTQSISAHTLFGHFHTTHFIFMIISLLLLQMGAHLVNDYYDYLRGIDTSNALGPGGLIQQGLVKPSGILIMGLILLAVGSLLGVIVAASGGPVLYLFGLIGLLCAYFYSAPPRAFSSLGLGEIIAFLLFGPLITVGAYILQVGHGSYEAFVYSLPLGFMAAAIIHVNNMRDVEGDMHAGKYTIASLVGLRLSRAWFLLLLLGAYAIPVSLAVRHHEPHLFLLTLWTFPLLVVVISGIMRTDAPASFHLIMRQMLRMEVYFTILFALALIILAFFPILPHLPTKILPI